MKINVLLLLLSLSAFSCLTEYPDNCQNTVMFKMLDVPYVLEESQIVDSLPYYQFINMLELYAFTDKDLIQRDRYDYEYCKTHPVIPGIFAYGKHYFLWAANLLDPKILDWSFEKGQFYPVFTIVNHEEPPTLLSALEEATIAGDEVLPVRLHMMVSRLEIQLHHPPVWVSGLNISVQNIAGAISPGFQLKGTTYITKQLALPETEMTDYTFGVNTFPTYSGQPASLSINLISASQVAPIIVDDSRMHFFPGVITRLNLAFTSENQVTISIEVQGKWEIIDEGHIII